MKMSIEGWRKWSLCLVGLGCYTFLMASVSPALPALELAFGITAMLVPQSFADVMKTRAQNGVKQ